MSFYGYGFKPYVSVAKRRAQAEQIAKKAQKKGAALSPVTASRGAIARTFWGRAWCDNLERYSDYENRLPRGRAYLRNGSVIDLVVGEGEVNAQVVGSRLYKVAIKVTPVPDQQWQAITADCAGSIDSLVELLQGKLSGAVMERICKPGVGLFPTPKEIKLDCSCPDWADMCKHVAAVLYGVGARLDAQPELLFRLRRVDAADLVKRAGAGLPTSGKRPASAKVLDDALLGDVFGIEMDEAAVPVPVKKPGVKTVAEKVVKKAASKAAKAPTKKVPAKPMQTVRPQSAKKPAKKSAKKTTKKFAVTSKKIPLRGARATPGGK